MALRGSAETLPDAPRGPLIGPPGGVQAFLTRFAVSLNRCRSYHATHPMVVRAEQQLLESIATMMATRAEVSFAVGPRELQMDGRPIRGRLTVTREVAARLHKRGVSTLTLQDSLTRDGVRTLLGWLAADPGSATARSLEVSGGAPQIPGVVVARIAYDRFVLSDSEQAAEEQATSIWMALARASRRRTPSVADDGSTEITAADDGATVPHDDASRSAEEIVHDIQAGVHEAEFAAQVSVVLFTLVDQATHASPLQRDLLGARLQSVLERLDDATLRIILTHMGDAEQQRRFLTEVAEALPVSAVVGWLEFAARASAQSLSHQLLRLLRKLASLAHEQPGSTVDETFRDAALELVAGWELDDPNPGEHVALLDQIALIDAERTAEDDRLSPMAFVADSCGEAGRVVQMGLELDEVSADARAAVHQLLAEGHATTLLDWIESSAGRAAARLLLAAVASPEGLAVVLLGEPPDARTVRTMLAAADLSAVPTLLDVLATSPVRMVRRLVFDRLREFADPIWPQLLARLDDASWYFARNLIALMRDIREAARLRGESLLTLPLTGVVRYLSHDREQVRVEATRLLLEEPSLRDGTLRRALDDSSDRVLRGALETMIALAAAIPPDADGGALPADLTTRLLQLAERNDLDAEVRARAVCALEAAPGTGTRRWLIAHVTRQTLITRRLVLADSTPSVNAALGVLARRHAHDPQVAAVITLARATNDKRRQAVAS